jgi:hypothetical protein
MSLTVYSALAVHLVQIMAKLYIAMYKPEEGNYEHWALFLNDGNQNVVFEVVGEHPNFTKRVIEANPKNSRRHERSILVGTINQQDVPELREKMDEVEVDNETVHWNCQDYVIEAIDHLHEECIIDDDDEDYERGRKDAVDNYYGPK